MKSTSGSKSTFQALTSINLVAEHSASLEPLTISFAGSVYSLDLKLSVKVPTQGPSNLQLSDALKLQVALQRLFAVINSIVSKQYVKRS